MRVAALQSLAARRAVRFAEPMLLMLRDTDSAVRGAALAAVTALCQTDNQTNNNGVEIDLDDYLKS